MKYSNTLEKNILDGRQSRHLRKIKKLKFYEQIF